MGGVGCGYGMVWYGKVRNGSVCQMDSEICDLEYSLGMARGWYWYWEIGKGGVGSGRKEGRKGGKSR